MVIMKQLRQFNIVKFIGDTISLIPRGHDIFTVTLAVAGVSFPPLAGKSLQVRVASDRDGSVRLGRSSEAQASDVFGSFTLLL